MKLMGKNNTQKGLTLVEVLAALVILGIVFVGFMTVFPQMTLFNAKTETKLDTMNLAREEMTEFVENADKQATECSNTASATNLNSTTENYLETRYNQLNNVKTVFVLNDPISIDDDYCLYSVNINEYLYEFFVYTEPDLEGDTNIPNSKSLFKTILKIKVNNQKSSETYGYIEVKEGS
ncbi:MAG: type II secretion system protein [Melioribacteraceae bacterium]|nr:type II secretion system protein [Melioribacteraceae bacterium]